MIGDFINHQKSFGFSHGYSNGKQDWQDSAAWCRTFTFLRDDAIRQTSVPNPFEIAVATVPVTMDGAARAELRDAALKAGIRIYQYVHEPLASIVRIPSESPELPIRASAA